MSKAGRHARLRCTLSDGSAFPIEQTDHAVAIRFVVRQPQRLPPDAVREEPVAFAGDHGMNEQPQRVEQPVPETAMPRLQAALDGNSPPAVLQLAQFADERFIVGDGDGGRIASGEARGRPGEDVLRKVVQLPSQRAFGLRRRRRFRFGPILRKSFIRARSEDDRVDRPVIGDMILQNFVAERHPPADAPAPAVTEKACSDIHP